MRYARVAFLVVFVVASALVSRSAFAQRALDCQSSDARALVLDLLAKQQKKNTPRSHLEMPKAAEPSLQGTFVVDRARPQPQTMTFSGRTQNQVHLVSSPNTALEVAAQHLEGGNLFVKVCHYKLRGGPLSLPERIADVLYNLSGGNKTLSRANPTFNEQLRGRPGEDTHVSLVWVSPADYLASYKYRLTVAPLR